MTSETATKYFDLHTHGLGYVHRIRNVPVPKGETYLAADIHAIHGQSGSTETVRFDCRVVGKDAEELIGRCVKAVNEHRSVLIGFIIGDLRPELFEYKQGERKGETGVSLKARLLKVKWIRVEGDLVFKASESSAGTDSVAGSVAQAA